MFVLKVITPQSKPRVLQTTIANLVTPSGQMGILSNHMPIITMINISKMTTIEDKVRKSYAVSGGVFFFKDNEATLLADAFESQEEIDLARAIAAKERAEERLKSQDPSIDIKRAQIALAGSGNPPGLASQGQMTRAFTGQGLFGCTGGITPTSIGHPQLHDIVCQDDPDQADAIVVRYEADTRNTLATAAGTPTDCLGNSTPLVDGTHHLADNRYFVHNHTLSCRGNGHSVSQPLVDHIVDLDLRYGIATPAASAPDDVTLRYLTAQEVSGSAMPASTSPLWRQVKAVRLCLVLRSELEVQDSAMTYTNCQGLTQAAPDRRLYRAFHTTVSLPNPL